MRALSLLCIIAFLVAQTYAACDPAKGNDTINPDCQSEDTPYCRLDPNGYNCVQCFSHCDCGMDEYCSSKADTFGTCVTFEKLGSECRPMPDTQLQDATISPDWKCASIIPNTSQVNFIDYRGVCIEGVCRMCDPRGGAGTPGCSNTAGLEAERVCVFPGHFIDTHYQNWAPGAYYENPELVWYAIFFCLIVLVLLAQVAILFVALRK